MEIIKIWNNKASDDQIEKIAKVIEDGGVAIIPTDTMYAIVSDALNMKAVEKVCQIKKINPEKTNLSIMCSDISMASEYSKIDNDTYNLMKEYTPGPFTFLLKAVSRLPRAFKGRKVVGIRIPDNIFDLSLIKILRSPLICTSIQYEDEDYAVNPQLIAESYRNNIQLMVEGEDGTTDVSTIIDCTDDEFNILRQGKGIIN